ncbi:unnamed protein product [Rotaria sp. Silwood2]|nr:unnamed protein product [Rotaria sp. Silwood2]CAF3090806.1 unnamed protein product [Rotaria sp. Silwood2]CAF3341539.1 unnamed protein product [Rotaria sp. Silwood2]CAF3437233.1 unnamed protein product [Rotaria sp. Silwood2]CAF4395405.1 unnamed protein product [Rotaria sp. Silwood2]
MPYLTHLHLTSSSNALDAFYGRLLELILNRYFESLTSVHLPQANFFGIFNCIGHSGLRNVTIGSCRSDRFGNLISLMPNVRYLEIRHLIKWPINQKIIHSNICHLKLYIGSVTINSSHEIEALKLALPSLRHVMVNQLKTPQSQCIPLSSYDTVRDGNNDEDDDDDDDEESDENSDVD